jgi:uncharacterized protein
MNIRNSLPHTNPSPERRGASLPSSSGRKVGDKAGPWFKQPWPWLLMVPPFFSVIGGVAMLWMAIASNDGLVAEDYYRQGLAINQRLTREQAAAAGNYRAHVLFTVSLDRVRVTLTGEAIPRALMLRLTHPTRSGLDRVVTLNALGGGMYEAELPHLVSGRWRVAIADEDQTWRLSGDWHVPEDNALYLAAGVKEAR